MSYLYSKKNRLDEPHSYMYAKFEGLALFDSHYEDRIRALESCSVTDCQECIEQSDAVILASSLQVLMRQIRSNSVKSALEFQRYLAKFHLSIREEKLGRENPLPHNSGCISEFVVSAPINTLDLLRALLVAQLTEAANGLIKTWLDRLIQRFEVTKKLYEVYPSGFRKGEGDTRILRLYWYFSLSLCLFYTETNQIKYLSTLLKVCDLLSSIPIENWEGQIPRDGFAAVIIAEIVCVRGFSKDRGVPFDTK